MKRQRWRAPAGRREPDRGARGTPTESRAHRRRPRGGGRSTPHEEVSGRPFPSASVGPGLDPSAGLVGLRRLGHYYDNESHLVPEPLLLWAARHLDGHSESGYPRKRDANGASEFF